MTYEFGDDVHQIAYECKRIIYYHWLVIAKISSRDPLTVVLPQPPYHDCANSAEDSGPDFLMTGNMCEKSVQCLMET